MLVDDALAKDAAITGNDDKIDERAVAAGKLVPRRGDGGTIFYMDDSDPKNVKVKMKVHLTGKARDVAKIKNLEDAIERASRTRGYNLDIEFVDHPGPDVFERTVDVAEWPMQATGPRTRLRFRTKRIMRWGSRIVTTISRVIPPIGRWTFRTAFTGLPSK